METVVWIALYALPIGVGAFRRHPSILGITALTLLLGWTVLGWIIALVWAFSGTPEEIPS